VNEKLNFAGIPHLWITSISSNTRGICICICP